MAFRFSLAAMMASSAMAQVQTLPGALQALADGLIDFDNEHDYSKEIFCHGWDLDTEDGAMLSWERSKVSGILNDWVSENGEQGWLRKYEEHIRGSIDSSETAGCGQFGSACNPKTLVHNCQTSWDDGETGLEKSAFWIFRAVQGVNEQLGMIHSHLYQATMLSGLRIDKMYEDLAVEKAKNPAGDVFKWLSRAFSMSNYYTGGAGVAPGNVALQGILSALFGIGADELDGKDDQDQEDIANIKQALVDACTKKDEQLKSAMSAAVGSSRDPKAYENLPGGHSKLSTNVGKFFESAPWLIDMDSEYIAQEMKNVGQLVVAKVAHEILLSQGYDWFHAYAPGWDRDDTTEESCSSTKGKQWLQFGDNHFCVFIGKKNEEMPSPEIFDKLAQYGLGDRRIWYKAIFDCVATQAGDDPSKDWLRSVEAGSDAGKNCFFFVPNTYTSQPRAD